MNGASIEPTVEEGLKLARSISHESVPENRVKDTERFLAMLKDFEAEQLSEITAKMASYDTNPGAVLKALREGAILTAETRNALSMVEATKSFDKTAARLTWALIVLSVVGLLVAFIPDSSKEPILHWFMGVFHIGWIVQRNIPA